MDVVTLKILAHPREQYPELDNLINELALEFLPEISKGAAYRTVRDVLIGLTRAELHGHISAGDEHEWAAVALRANELATEANRVERRRH